MSSDAESPRAKTASTLGPKVRHLRRQRGIRQYELAAQAGISSSYLSDIERDRVATPSLMVLDGLAAALETSRIDLLRAAGVVDVDEIEIHDRRLQKLMAVYRDLSVDGRRSLEQYARFVHAEEHRWVQQPILPEWEERDESSVVGPLFGEDR